MFQLKSIITQKVQASAPATQLAAWRVRPSARISRQPAKRASFV